MTERLSGKPVAEQIKKELRMKIEGYRSVGILPRIAILRAGDEPDDIAYESRVIKNCEEVGISFQQTIVDRKINMESFSEKVKELNEDENIHGMLIFRPLPDQLDEEAISSMIAPEKDIDCMNPLSLSKVFTGDRDGIAPCTPEAVVELFRFYGVELEGKHAVIVNRSMVLGKPLAMLLLAEHATVTVCHSRTKNLKELTRAADLVVTGVGRPGYFDPSYFSKDAVVADVGINFKDGVMCGDVDFKCVEEKGEVRGLTPVPGGIGGITSAILLKHVLKCMELQERSQD